MYALIAAPAHNDRSPRYMEKALAAVHQALRPGQSLRLQYAARDGQLGLAVEFPAHLKDAVLGPLSANYPKAHVEVLSESPQEIDDRTTWYADVRLTPDLFPILRHSQFEDALIHAFADPIDSLLAALKPDASVSCRMEFTITLAAPPRVRRAKLAVSLMERDFFRRHKRLAKWFIFHASGDRQRRRVMLLSWLAGRSAPPQRETTLDVSAGNRHEREADLQAAADKLGGHLFAVSLRVRASANSDNAVSAKEKLHAVVSALGSFTRSRLATFSTGTIREGIAGASRDDFLLSHEELATLWHPPTAGVAAERMQVAPFSELEAPIVLPAGTQPGEVPVGRVQYRSDRRMFGLSRDDRRRHVHIVGRTGVGKTTLLLNQIVSDINAGEGVGLIDPHGDLADTVLRHIPRHRTNDVILFDASDREFAVSFNPLACPDPGRIDLVTSGAVAAFKKIYGDSWGPRLENTLRNAVFATVEQGGTLVTLLRLLTDAAYRESSVPSIRDEVVRAFWQQEFAGWTKQYRTEAVAAITNKIQPFLTNGSVRAIVSQEGRSLDLRHAMDDGKILIVNLSKGKVGEDNAALLGAFLVTTIQQAAMTRADIPEAERRDFYLYIDEFQNFVTTSFETILSEARKYRLNLTVSHQYLAQLNEATAAAIAGNIGSIISFAVGSEDAQWLARAMATAPDQLLPQDLANLPKHTAYARLQIDGLPRPPFSMTTSPPPELLEDRSRTVIEASRRQHGRRLAIS